MLPMLIGPVAGLLNSVFKRVLPAEKMSEKERAEIENAMQAELMKADWSFIEKQADIIVAETKGSWLSCNWRPITMLTFVVIIANNYILYPYLSLFFDKAPMLKIPPDMWNLLKIGIGGYIVGRSAESTMKAYKK
tara:strand:- start:258 stop:662 length:405 start_codon:yes stop_codon:yes gene_type:complete